VADITDILLLQWPIAVADHRLARQIIAWQSWFRRNRHFAFDLCIKGALYLHMWCLTLVYDIVFVTLLPTSYQEIFLVDPSRRQVGHLWNRLL